MAPVAYRAASVLQYSRATTELRDLYDEKSGLYNLATVRQLAASMFPALLMDLQTRRWCISASAGGHLSGSLAGELREPSLSS